jgi:hypothetical protein
MIKPHRILWLACLALILLPAVPSLAQDETEVHIQRFEMHCEEGEECEEHEMLFIGEDGERHLIQGGDAPHVWVSGDDMARVMLHAGAFGRGFLGVELTELTPELRLHFGVPDDEGVMVARVIEDSPAAAAGIRVGDIVAQVDGQAIASGAALSKVIGEREPGEVVALQLWRDGGVESVTATVGEREGMQQAFAFRTESCEGEDCPRKVIVKRLGVVGDSACGDREECEIEVTCRDDGECECTINGEPADCDEIEHGEWHHRSHHDQQ